MGKRKNKVYSAEFKISVIMDMREHRLGYRETARKYAYTALALALMCFENYKDNLPYTFSLMESLICFCSENSPAIPMVKKLQMELQAE